MLIERLSAFTLLKSVDSGKLFQTLITLHTKKRLSPGGAGTTGFVQLVLCTACSEFLFIVSRRSHPLRGGEQQEALLSQRGRAMPCVRQ